LCASHAAVYLTANVSGGHLNPAVTIATMVRWVSMLPRSLPCGHLEMVQLPNNDNTFSVSLQWTPWHFCWYCIHNCTNIRSLLGDMLAGKLTFPACQCPAFADCQNLPMHSKHYRDFCGSVECAHCPLLTDLLKILIAADWAAARPGNRHGGCWYGLLQSFHWAD